MKCFKMTQGYFCKHGIFIKNGRRFKECDGTEVKNGKGKN